MASKRILVFVNKAWEADPLIGVLTNKKAKPARLPTPSDKVPEAKVPIHDGTTRAVKARARFSSPQGDLDIWCIQDLMDPKKKASSSEEKARVIPYAVATGPAADLVIAMGTAASPRLDSENGSVVIGANVFANDPLLPSTNSDSQWTHPQLETLITATPPGALDVFAQEFRAHAESRFLAPPMNPASPPVAIISKSLVAVSNVNVTNPAIYAWADRQTLASFERENIREPIGSVETTHGVIRLVVPSPEFFFISGIANKIGYFDRETAVRDYAQNFVASHNAAICLAWLIPDLLA